MKRKNIEIERFEKENAYLRDRISRLLEIPPEIPFFTCDSSCVNGGYSTGMQTNGGCRYDERQLRNAVQFWQQRARYLQAVLVVIRDGDPLYNAEQTMLLWDKYNQRTT